METKLEYPKRRLFIAATCGAISSIYVRPAQANPAVAVIVLLGLLGLKKLRNAHYTNQSAVEKQQGKFGKNIANSGNIYQELYLTQGDERTDISNRIMLMDLSYIKSRHEDGNYATPTTPWGKSLRSDKEIFEEAKKEYSRQVEKIGVKDFNNDTAFARDYQDENGDKSRIVVLPLDSKYHEVFISEERNGEIKAHAGGIIW